MDQGAIDILFTQNFRQLINENDESSIKNFWKKYNIEDAVENISESWKALKSTTMNHVKLMVYLKFDGAFKKYQMILVLWI